MNFSDVNREVLRAMKPPRTLYWGFVSVLFLGLLGGAGAWAHQIAKGLGVAGYNHPVVWAVYITSFVYWVGIAHSGTLISAILFLFRARWRTAISRSAEAMTVFAIATAGLFPLIHLGRVWVVYWILPYPNERNLWPNFQSPLVLDVLAISTYLTVSVLFWYMGLIPDLAAARDQATGLRKKIYGFLSLNWTGEFFQWRHYGWAYLLFAALATALVVSVHSVVSWDFALSIVPGWHSTIFAPYFVAGAIHSGLAMVLVLLIPLRKIFRFENIITLETLGSIAKTAIFTGVIMGYSYVVEPFLAWYNGSTFEKYTFFWRVSGHYAMDFWFMLACNALAPFLFFFKRIRTNVYWLFTIAVLIVIAMWFERYVIIVASVAREFDPALWRIYRPTWVEISIFIGSASFFFFFFFLFAKFLPTISLSDLKKEAMPPVREDKEIKGS